MPVKFQSYTNIIRSNHVASRLYEIRRRDILPPSELRPWRVLDCCQTKKTVKGQTCVKILRWLLCPLVVAKCLRWLRAIQLTDSVKVFDSVFTIGFDTVILVRETGASLFKMRPRVYKSHLTHRHTNKTSITMFYYLATTFARYIIIYTVLVTIYVI